MENCTENANLFRESGAENTERVACGLTHGSARQDMPGASFLAISADDISSGRIKQVCTLMLLLHTSARLVFFPGVILADITIGVVAIAGSIVHYHRC